jgi:hypothetical protein
MSERDEEDRQRERLSWREVDKRKDGSRHVAPESAPKGKRQSQKAEWLRKMALKEANKVFQGKQGTPRHEAAVSELQQHFGTKKFQSLARKYLEDFGVPQHWGTRFLFLDYEDPEVVSELLQDMVSQYPERSPREQQALISKLRTLAALAEDPEVQDRAAELLSSLS